MLSSVSVAPEGGLENTIDCVAPLAIVAQAPMPSDRMNAIPPRSFPIGAALHRRAHRDSAARSDFARRTSRCSLWRRRWPQLRTCGEAAPTRLLRGTGLAAGSPRLKRLCEPDEKPFGPANAA